MVIEASGDDDDSFDGNTLPSQVSLTLSYSEDEADQTYCEKTPLLASGRSRHPSTVSRHVSVTKAEPLSLWTLSRSQKIILATTSITDLLAYLSVSIMAPFFPEEALKKGVSSTLSGWIFGISPFTQFLISPLIGKLIPIVGVKFMFIAGVFVFSSCTILFGFLSYVPSDNGYVAFVVMAFACQVLKSIGITSAATSSFVLCVQEFPDNVATVLACGEIFVGLGLVTGPAVGGVLYGLGGFYLPFVIIGGLGLCSVPFLMCALPHQTAFEDTVDNRMSMTKVFLCPLGILTSITIVASTFMWAILDPTLEPHLRQFNLRPEIVGLIFLVMAAMYALSAPLWGWISDKLTEQRGLLIIGFLFATLGSLLLGPSSLLGLDPNYSQLWLVIVALLILGASASLSSIPTFDIFFTLAEEKGCEDDTKTYSSVAGFWLSMYSLGDFLGPSVGGALLDTVGFQSMCTYSAGLCLFMAFLLSISWLIESKCWKRKDLSNNSATKINEAYESFSKSECYRTSNTVMD